MDLTPMRYKDYTWPHNPQVYTVEYQRRLASLPAPGGGCVLQELGFNCRVLRGEGEFAGEDAYEQFQRLAAVFQEDGPGLLIHPVWRAEQAYFVELSVREEPLPDYVRYSFEFWEDWSGAGGGLTEARVSSGSASGSGAQAGTAQGTGRSAVYTVKKGDTLWGIARSRGVPLERLIKANPQIKNPNLIYPGNEVTIP